MAPNDEVTIRLRAKDSQRTKSDIKDVGDEVEKLGDTGGRIGKVWESTASTIKSSVSAVSDALTANRGKIMAAGATVATLFAAGLTQAMDVQAATGKLQAQLGLSDRQAERVGKISAGLYKDAWGESVDDVNAAIASVGQNIRDVRQLTNRELRRMTAQTMNLAQTFGAEANEITRTVGAMIANGLARDTNEAFDLLTRGFQLGADKGGEFLDTLNEYAEPVRSLGLSGEDFINALVVGAKNGVWSVDKIGDAVKEFTIRAVDGSEATRDAFRKLNLEPRAMAEAFAAGGPAAKKATGEVLTALAKIRDPVKRERVGVALFGSMWEDIGWQAISGLNPAADALGRTEGATRRMGRALNDNAKTRIEAFKRAVMTGITEAIGSHALPALDKLMDKLEPLAPILVPAAFGLGALAIALTVAAAGQWALNIAMAANPLVWIAALIIGLGVAVFVAYKRSATFRDIVHKVWGALKAAGRWIAGAGVKAWHILKDAVGVVWQVFKRTPTGFLLTNLGKIVGFIKEMPGKIANAAKGMWGGIKTAFRSAVNWILRKWNALEFKIPVPAGGLAKKLGLGSGLTIGTPDIPLLWQGGTVASAGAAVVGDRGAELLELPVGAKVTPLRDDKPVAAAPAGDSRLAAALDRIADQLARLEGMPAGALLRMVEREVDDQAARA